MHRGRVLRSFWTTLAFVVALSVGPVAQGDGGVSILSTGNDGLRAQGMDYLVQQIDFFQRDGVRSSDRFFQQEFRWVPDDPRRDADGAGLTYLFDTSWGEETADGIDRPAVEASFGRAVDTWAAAQCLDGVALTAIPHDGSDVTIFDWVVDAGGLGDPFAADVIVAGFPEGMRDFFGPDTLAFSVTFVFVDGDGRPTDLDGDGHLDTARNEIYLNPDADWSLSGAEGFDLETTGLHELGHALGLGHFGAPPESVMSPVFTGVKRDLFPIDQAALCVVHGNE
ncbi:MAG: matrixin family metalloprotease [Thermoanaerobaculia bacterium]